MSKKQITLFQTWNKTPVSQETDRNTLRGARNITTSLQHLASPDASSSHTFQPQKFPKKDDLADPEFDYEAGKTWIYPTNYPVRDYQFSIVQEALFRNTLVVLPTGLGKTFIAAVVMYNIYRWFPNGKVVFMAPTKPLVAQQVDACFNITGIPQEDTTQMTGTNAPELRKRMWQRKRVFFLTPQVLVNDLVRNICPPTSIKCVVVDEAHKALGNHAYCQVIKELCAHTTSFRVLALTATPGSDTQAVKQVFANLLISHVEMRSEDSEDVQQYTHIRDIEKIVVPLGDRLTTLKNKFLDVINIYLKRLTLRKVITAKNPGSLSKFQVLKLRETFSQHPPSNIDRATYGMAMADFSLLISLYHAYELLLLHGAVSFYNFLNGILNGDKSIPHARTELLKNYEFEQIMEEVKKTYIPEPLNSLQNGQNSHSYLKKKVLPGHPKLDKLLEVVLLHFRSTERDANTNTRVMIFTQYRDSVQEIVNMLNQYQPTVKVMSFIGQASKSGTSAGYSQKQQLKVIQQFRAGGYNTLVSTCVGEEGLDIGEVDLIVCYDCPKSPIRLVQRMGRTGRLRKGQIIILIAEGKEEQMFNTCEYRKKTVHRAITRGFSFAQFYQNSPSLLPPGVKPHCVKMLVTIQRKKQEPKVLSKSPFLNDEEMAEFDQHVRIQRNNAPVLPKREFMVLKNQKDLEAGSTSTVSQKPQISLSEWTLWQTTPQRTDLIPHSSKSLLLVRTLEYIHFPELLSSKKAFTADYCDIINNSANSSKLNNPFKSFTKQSKITDCLSTSKIDKNDFIEISSSPEEEAFDVDFPNVEPFNLSDNRPFIQRLLNANIPSTLKKTVINDFKVPPPVTNSLHTLDFSNVDVQNIIRRENKSMSVLSVLNKKMKAKIKRKMSDFGKSMSYKDASVNLSKTILNAQSNVNLNKKAQLSSNIFPSNVDNLNLKQQTEDQKELEHVIFDVDFDIPDTYEDNLQPQSKMKTSSNDLGIISDKTKAMPQCSKRELGDINVDIDLLEDQNSNGFNDFSFANNSFEAAMENKDIGLVDFDVDFTEAEKLPKENKEIKLAEVNELKNPSSINHLIDTHEHESKLDLGPSKTVPSANSSCKQTVEKEQLCSINFDIDFMEVDEELSITNNVDTVKFPTNLCDETDEKKKQNDSKLSKSTTSSEKNLKKLNKEERQLSVLKDVKNICHTSINEINNELKGTSYFKSMSVTDFNNCSRKNVQAINNTEISINENINDHVNIFSDSKVNKHQTVMSELTGNAISKLQNKVNGFMINKNIETPKSFDNSSSATHLYDIDELGDFETVNKNLKQHKSFETTTLLYDVSTVNNSPDNSKKGKLSLIDKNKVLCKNDKKLPFKNIEKSLADSTYTNVSSKCVENAFTDKTDELPEELGFNFNVSFSNNAMEENHNSTAHEPDLSSESTKMYALSKNNDFIDDLDEFDKDASSILDQLFTSQKNMSTDLNTSFASPLTIKKCVSEADKKKDFTCKNKNSKPSESMFNQPSDSSKKTSSEKSDLFKIPPLNSHLHANKTVNLGTNKNINSPKSNLSKTHLMEDASQYSLTQLLSLIDNSEGTEKSILEKSYHRASKYLPNNSENNDISSEDEVCPTPPKNIIKSNAEFIYSKKPSVKSLDFTNFESSDYKNCSSSERFKSGQNFTPFECKPQSAVGNVSDNQEKIQKTNFMKPIPNDSKTDDIRNSPNEDKNDNGDCELSPKITFDVSFDLPFTQDDFESSERHSLDMNKAILIESSSSEELPLSEQNNDNFEFCKSNLSENEKVNLLDRVSSENMNKKADMHKNYVSDMDDELKTEDSESLLPSKPNEIMKLNFNSSEKTLSSPDKQPKFSNFKCIRNIRNGQKTETVQKCDTTKNEPPKNNEEELNDFESSIFYKCLPSKDCASTSLCFTDSEDDTKRKSEAGFTHKNNAFCDNKIVPESLNTDCSFSFLNTASYNPRDKAIKRADLKDVLHLGKSEIGTPFKNAKNLLEEKKQESAHEYLSKKATSKTNEHLECDNAFLEDCNKEKLYFDLGFEDETCDLLPPQNNSLCHRDMKDPIKNSNVMNQSGSSNLNSELEKNVEFKSISKNCIFKNSDLHNSLLDKTHKPNEKADKVISKSSLENRKKNIQLESQKNSHSVNHDERNQSVINCEGNDSSDEFDFQNQTIKTKKSKELGTKNTGRQIKSSEADCSNRKPLNDVAATEKLKTKNKSNQNSEKGIPKTVYKKNAYIDDEEDDFQFIQKIQKKNNNQQASESRKRKRLSKRSEFLCTQAEASGSDDSYHESADEEEDLEMSFIDDESPQKMDCTDQHAFYMKSVKDCVGLPQKYKLKDMEISSVCHAYEEDHSNYEYDSFCVNDEDVMYLSSDENLECYAESRRKNRAKDDKHRSKKLKHVVTYDSSTSSESEISPKRRKFSEETSNCRNMHGNTHDESIIARRKPKNKAAVISSDEEDEHVFIKPADPEPQKKTEIASAHSHQVDSTSSNAANAEKLEFCVDFDDDVEFISEVNGFIDAHNSVSNLNNARVPKSTETTIPNLTPDIPSTSKGHNSEIVECTPVSILDEQITDVSFDIGWDEIHLANSSNSKTSPISTNKDLPLNGSVKDRNEPVILVDSRELASGKPVISSLRNRLKMNPVVMQLSSADYIVSNRMAVERVSESEFNNCPMPPKIIEKVREMIGVYETSVVIIEKDHKKNVLSFTKGVTKYMQFIIHLNYHPHVKVLFSKSSDHTSELIDNLVQQEKKRGFQINVPVAMYEKNRKLFDFYSSFPRISPICALNFMYNFPTVESLLKASVKDLKRKGSISSQKAVILHKYFNSQLTFHEKM